MGLELEDVGILLIQLGVLSSVARVILEDIINLREDMLT